MGRVLGVVGLAVITLASGTAFGATVNFGSLPQGAILTNQLQAQGVVFVPVYGVSGVIGASPAGNVATFNYAPGVEFPTFAGQANFSALHSTVSAHVGVAPGTNTTSMTLTGFDSSGNSVSTMTGSVSPAVGFATQLSVASAATNIASITLVATGGNNTSAPVMLDLSFDNAGNSPDFALGGPVGVQLVAGQTSTVTIGIRRFGSSTGAIAFSIVNLNAGVTSAFAPNPASGSVQLTLTAAADANPSATNASITGTPSVPGAGPAPRTVRLHIDLVQPVTISGTALIDVSTCSNNGPTGTVTRSFFVQRDASIAGPLTVSVEGLPSNVQAQLDPMTLTFPGGVVGQTVTSTLTVVGGLAVPDTMAFLHVNGSGVDQRFAFMIFGVCSRHQMDFVARGAWFCQNAGTYVFPLQHAVVEFFRHRSVGYDDKVGEVVTNDDGSYGVNLWAGQQGDYYARLHLDDHLGAHLNGSWDLNFWSIDSEHLSNQSPLLDFGALKIWANGGSGTPKCAIWAGAHKAHEEYKKTLPPPNPEPVPDYSIIIWEGFLSPYSSLASTNWPDGYNPSITPGFVQFDDFRDFMGNFHEFGHRIRQSVDGDYTHFTNDASMYTYGRRHGYCDLMGYVGTAAFAFNEGWAEYWSTETFGCPEDPLNMNVEGTVARDLVPAS